MYKISKAPKILIIIFDKLVVELNYGDRKFIL